jgi:Transposase DDE domain
MQKKRYHVRNWQDYNEALVKRGYINFWFDEEVIQQWYATETQHKRGRPKIYSDMAIQCALTMREVFRLPLRATEGLIRSFIEWGNLGIQSPDYSTLCLRQKS